MSTIPTCVTEEQFNELEHWGLMDNMALMQQLGVMPAPGEGEG